MEIVVLILKLIDIHEWLKKIDIYVIASKYKFQMYISRKLYKYLRIADRKLNFSWSFFYIQYIFIYMLFYQKVIVSLEAKDISFHEI